MFGVIVIDDSPTILWGMTSIMRVGVVATLHETTVHRHKRPVETRIEE